MVLESELRDLLRKYGWYLYMAPQGNVRAAIAKRRLGKKVITRYLKSESKFAELTPSFIEARISLTGL